MCAAAGIESYDKSCNRGRIEYNPQGEGGLDDPACGCLLCRKEGSKSGSLLSLSPHQTAIGSCRVNLPIRGATYTVLTHPTDGGGSRENKARWPPHSKYSEFVFASVCVYVCVRVYVCMRMWVPLTSLVSHRVLNYPMGALIELETLLIVSLDEGEIEGRKRGAQRSCQAE